MNPAAPGWKSSEFVLTVATHVLTALTLSGVVAADNKWAMFASMLMSALAQMSYNSSRGEVKSAVIAADASVSRTHMETVTPVEPKVAAVVRPQELTAEQRFARIERAINVIAERLPAKPKEVADEAQSK